MVLEQEVELLEAQLQQLHFPRVFGLESLPVQRVYLLRKQV